MSVDQDQKMAAILARLSVTSNGTIYSYSVVPSGGSFGHGEPRSGDAYPPHIRYLDQYNQAKSDGQRAQVIRDAEKELRDLTHSTSSGGETVNERDDRLIREGEGFPAFDVALRFRLGVKDVWAIRRRFGRDKDLGHVIPDAPLDKAPASERRKRVREMKQKGMSARQIALVVKVSRTTVLEDLKNAA